MHGELSFSPEGYTHQINIVRSTENALKALTEIYPGLEFEHRDRLSSTELYEKLRESTNNKLVGTHFSKTGKEARSFPDGGLSYLLSKNEKGHLIGVTEAKYQGIGKKRNKKGKGGGGNAWQRAFRDVREVAHYCIAEDILPTCVFFNGPDFEGDTSVTRALSKANMGLPFDTLYLNKIDFGTRKEGAVSIFVGITKEEDVTQKILEMFIGATEYHLKKYPNDF